MSLVIPWDSAHALGRLRHRTENWKGSTLIWSLDSSPLCKRCTFLFSSNVGKFWNPKFLNTCTFNIFLPSPQPGFHFSRCFFLLCVLSVWRRTEKQRWPLWSWLTSRHISRSWRDDFIEWPVKLNSRRSFFLLSLAGWTKRRQSLSYQMVSRLFLMMLFVFRCICWPERERKRQPAPLSGQQASLGFHILSSAVPWITKCLLVPFIHFLKWTGQMLHSQCLLQDKRLYLAVFVCCGHKCFWGIFEEHLATVVANLKENRYLITNQGVSSGYKVSFFLTS